jgi:crossover junction endodeoxyribonuclease RuvC
MRILGIDPGTARVGYGLVDVGPDWQPAIVTAGVITTSKALPLARRLHEIHSDLSALIAQFQPDCAAVEELFFVRNITNGIGVAMSRGVILLAAAQAGLEVAGYVPMVVKQTVVGHGRAEKCEVQETVRDLLALDQLPKPDDAADGLAIALCHLRHLEVGNVLAATI